MSMISMKRSDIGCSPCEPHTGLTLYLSNEQCEALGITQAPDVNTEVMFKAKAKITSVSSDAGCEGKVERRLVMEISHMEIGSFSDGVSSAADGLYGE